MADIKDIFTKKDLSEVESKRKAQREEAEAQLKEALTGVIEKYQNYLAAGELTGIIIAGTTRDGIEIPDLVSHSVETTLKLKFAADLIQALSQEECLYAFGLIDEEGL